MEVQDNCEMRNSNTYVLRGLQNVFNVEVQDNYKISNKYVLRGLQNEINVEVQDNCERNNNKCFTWTSRLMWKYKIIVR